MATSKKKETKKRNEKGTKEEKELFLKLLVRNAGNKSKTCKAMNVSRQTVYNWRDDDPEFKKQLDEVDETLIDDAESALMKAIKDGNVTAIIFFLKTKGKSRGYVESMDMSADLHVSTNMSKEEIIKELDRLRELNG